MLAYLRSIASATNQNISDVLRLYCGWKLGNVACTALWEEMIANLKKDFVDQRLKTRKRTRED